MSRHRWTPDQQRTTPSARCAASGECVLPPVPGYELFRFLARPTPRITDNGPRNVKMRPVPSMCSHLAIVMATLAALSAAIVGARAEDRSPVIDVRTGDPEMNAAIAQARTTLPKFWASYGAPQPS